MKVLGDLSRFPEDIRNMSKEWVALSQKNNKITVSFALNYGGRNELLRAFREILAIKPRIKPEQLTEETLERHLDTAGMPDPDLIIRPSGQIRLSGFMPWQSAYSELYFTDTLIPDFSVGELDKAITDFEQRQRRYGK